MQHHQYNSDGIFKIMDIVKHFYANDADEHILVIALIAIVIFDIALGVARAWSTDSFSSRKWRKGMTGHFAIITIVTMTYPFFYFMGFSAIADTYSVAMCAAYGSSILSNLSVLGVKVPYLDDIIRQKVDSEKFELIDNQDSEKK